MSFNVEVWGDYACFTRPELKAERVSYDVMTPSAARGILTAIYWHPGMKWIIDSIKVCAPIKHMNIKRNEVGSVISSNTVLTAAKNESLEGLYLVASNDRQQRSSLVLRDVHYVITAHFEMTESATETDSAAKFASIIDRRLTKGQCYYSPYFGCREFPVNFKKCETAPLCPEELKGTRHLGFMLYDMDYSDPQSIKPMFFDAKLVDGVLTVPPESSEEVRR